jgi:hypothetical protein
MKDDTATILMLVILTLVNLLVLTAIMVNSSC